MATQVPTKRKWGDVATVTLIVGESKTVFQLHEVKLFETSSFFKAAFTSRFREAAERSMKLPDDDEGAFEDFAEWLYGGKLRLKPASHDARYTALLKVFILADKYHVLELKNTIIERIFHLGKEFAKAPSLTDVSYVYQHTVEDSGIRKLLADWHAWNIDLGWFERPDVQVFLRQHPDCATDFSVSLAKRFRKAVTDEVDDPFIGDMPEKYRDKEPEQEDRAT